MLLEKLVKKDKSGFTLIEVMVALVITALLVTVLMSSLRYILQIDEAIQREAEFQEVKLQAPTWIMRVLESCLPAARDTYHSFTGDSKSIQCDSLTPLLPRIANFPVLVKLRLQDNKEQTDVFYHEVDVPDSKEVFLTTLPIASGEFVFRNSQKQMVKIWPYAKEIVQIGSMNAGKESESLPQFIQIIASNNPELVAVSVNLLATPWVVKKEIPLFLR